MSTSDSQKIDQQFAAIEGQVAVVTGGGRGIGRAIALALATAGARVAVLARSQVEIAETVELIKQRKGRAQAFTADVTDSAKVSATMTKIEHSLGPVDVLINNAACLGPIGPFVESDTVAWWRTMDVNLRGPLLCTHAVLPQMISRRCGRIVNIVSSVIPIPYFSSYVTSKTALVLFTETVAAEVKAHGVNMFALAPGTVRTAMSEYSLDSPGGKKWLPWFRRIFDEGLDLPAERPAQFVVRLASGEADSLSGRFLSVFDDLEVLLRSIREIESNSLHSLRVRKLSERNTALASIHAQAQHALGFTLRLERSFTALCAELFRLWLEPEAIKKWFVYHAPVHWVRPPKVEATPGGHYNWSVTSDDDPQKAFAFHGTYHEIKSNQKIVFTWEWDTLPIEDIEGPGNTVVTLEFVQQGESTRLTLTQANLPSEASRQAHQKGWERCLDGITKLILEKN